MAIKVESHRCPQNHPCPVVRVCPAGAITQRGFAAPEINTSRCIDCGICTRYCGYGAIRKV
ncbi:4Fe-4S binding protein [Spirochaetia bacterium 38H-sp]|uniref:4Fe-4S binding protein n=1 Tax=Rarispira pelagica TaxID=3141764 RepID=A0ABU9U8C1_9SPIR